MDRDRVFTPFEDCQRWCIQHAVPVLLFIGITALLLWQRSQGWRWDFLVYSMNGQFLFHGGGYMEWYRPPVTPVIMGLLSYPFGQLAAEYCYIALSSLLFFIGSARFADRFDLRLGLLYPLLVTPAATFTAMAHGTEMLAMAFTLLFFADIGRSRSGIWMAGAFLTRYTSGLLVPLGVFGKDRRTLVQSYVLAALPVLAWFGYNWAATGHPLTSIGNSIGLNMVWRSFSQPVDWLGLAQFALIPVVVALHGLRHRDRIETSLRRLWAYVPVMLFGLLSAISYLRTPTKTARYIYPLVLPLAVIGAALGQQRQRLAVVLAVVSLLGSAAMIGARPLAPAAPFQEASERLGTDCMAASDVWPQMNYAGTPTVPAPTPAEMDALLEQGYDAAIFHGYPIEELNASFRIEETLHTTYLVTDGCVPARTIDETYLERLRDRLEYDPVRATPCGAIFHRRCPWSAGEF